jgi:hypothetical protein
MTNLVFLENVKAPMPQMHPDAAALFKILRDTVLNSAGFDFLGVCGDISRPANYTSTKDGVANRSWHKTGRAFDYDQECKNLVIVSEPNGGKQFFRTYLKTAKQDGSQGKYLKVKDYRGAVVTAWLFDFTEAAEMIGFKRIPAWNGWQKNYNRREFWHYQYDQGLTWHEAMQQLRGKTASQSQKILGVNDRGEKVKAIQSALNRRGLLPSAAMDGVFGEKTKTAVIAFQKNNKLTADGLVGARTITALKLESV